MSALERGKHILGWSILTATAVAVTGPILSAQDAASAANAEWTTGSIRLTDPSTGETFDDASPSLRFIGYPESDASSAERYDLQPPPQEPEATPTSAPAPESAAGSAPAPNQAAADGSAPGLLAYSYIDGRILFGDYSGLAIEGSYLFNEKVYAIGHIELTHDSFGGIDVDSGEVSGGVGFRHELKPGLDLVGTAELDWIQYDVGGGGSDYDDWGVRLRSGARWAINQKFELRGGLTWRSNQADIDREWVLDVAGQYNLNQHVGLIGEIEIGEDVAVSVGARYNF